MRTYCIVMWSPVQYKSVPHQRCSGQLADPAGWPVLLPNQLTSHNHISNIVLGPFLALTFFPPAFFQPVQSSSVHRNAEVFLKVAARGRCIFVLVAVVLDNIDLFKTVVFLVLSQFQSLVNVTDHIMNLCSPRFQRADCRIFSW